MRIILLSQDIANKIAAGEVVERPASVLKELAENSIDAGAASIQIDVLGGGLEQISVTDDGCGMSPEDAQRAFERHATSKISAAEDLFSIGTLGFRGEALPSIASVARVALITREQGAAEGTMVTAEGGLVGKPSPVGAPRGTTVTVRDLFFNTPARLKYLRSIASETRRVIDVAGRLALAHPEASVSLSVGGKTVFTTPRGGSLREAIVSVLGIDLAKAMAPIDRSQQGISVRGFIGPAKFAKSARDVQQIFVNGRPVSSKTAWAAIDRAYDRTVPPGKHAPVVLSIEVDPSMVDVNVHPAKSEVRFAADSQVYSAVYNAVSAALRGGAGAAEIQPEALAEAPAPVTRDDRSGWAREPWGYPGAVNPVRYASGRDLASAAFDGASQRDSSAPEPAVEAAVGAAVVPVRIIGQLSDTYILAESTNGLVIVDQHVAHERILVDQFRQEYAMGTPSSQLLLAPAVVELSAADAQLIADNLATLSKMGFDVDVFGVNSIVVRGVPTHSEDVAPEDALAAAVEGIVAAPPGSDPVSMADHIAISLACKAAVKAGGRLRPEEMESLLERLFRTSDPYRCPHGRPIVVVIQGDDLARSFGRK